MSIYTVYTDGSCKPNPGTGGFGVVILRDGQPYKERMGACDDTTNNQMEMLGVIDALDHIPAGADITVMSDSKYVVNTLTKGWKRNKNKALWRAIDDLVESKDLKVAYQWVKGHADNEHNNRADELAQEAASDLKEKNG